MHLFFVFKYVMHHKASATTSQEYLIPLFLQALDFFTTKTNSSTKATSPSTDQRIQHSFPLEHCYCTRTLNIRFGSDLIVSILCLFPLGTMPTPGSDVTTSKS